MKKLRFAFFASVIFALATSMGCNADIGEPDVSQVTNPGENNGTGTNGGENSGNKADVTLDLPVEVSATDRGIKFSATILSNIYDGDSKLSAAVMFSIREQESGIEMVRDWKKTPGAWETCDMYYPFVDAGKEYTFYFSASFENHNFYEGELKATATGGIGEFKIENPEECKPVLTKDKVIKSGKPKYTDNPNVRIAREGIMYEIYADDSADDWTWVYGDKVFIGDKYFGDIYNGEIDIKKSDVWRSFEQMDNMLKGREYRLDTHTRIDVAGYTDNGQTYFNMDFNRVRGTWEAGSKKPQVYVIFGERGIDSKYYEDLPGKKMKFTVTKGEQKEEITYNYMIVDYGSKILEPVSLPKLKNCPEAKFDGWTLNGWNSTFPYDANPQKSSEELQTADGEEVEYFTHLIPKFKLPVKVTGILLNGKEVDLGTFDCYGSWYKDFEYRDEFDYFSSEYFTGLYVDKECAERAYYYRYRDDIITGKTKVSALYAKQNYIRSELYVFEYDKNDIEEEDKSGSWNYRDSYTGNLNNVLYYYQNKFDKIALSLNKEDWKPLIYSDEIVPGKCEIDENGYIIFYGFQY